MIKDSVCDTSNEKSSAQTNELPWFSPLKEREQEEMRTVAFASAAHGGQPKPSKVAVVEEKPPPPPPADFSTFSGSRESERRISRPRSASRFVIVTAATATTP